MVHKRKILVGSDFESFLTPPLSLNGATDWRPDWLVDQIFVRGGFNIIGGVPKAGKSLLRSHLIVCAMAGCPALSDYAVHHPAKRTLLLAGEEAAEIEETRLRRAARGLGIHDGILQIQIMPQRGFFFDDYASYERFTEWILEEGFDLVVIDPLIRWHRANENVSGELSPVLSNLRILTAEGVTLVVIHHTGKPREGQEDWPLGYLLRGSSDLAAVYDHVIVVKHAGAKKSRRTLLFETRYGSEPVPAQIELLTTEDSYAWTRILPVDEVVRRWFQRKSPDTTYSANEVAKSIPRNRNQVLAAVQELVVEGFIEKTEGGFMLPSISLKSEV